MGGPTGNGGPTGPKHLDIKEMIMKMKCDMFFKVERASTDR